MVATKPDSKVHGTLRLSEAGVVLELDGTLGEINALVPSPFIPDIILGQSLEAARVTLYKCFQLQTGGNLPSGLTTSKIDAQVVLFGAHFNSFDDIKFGKIEIIFPYLNEWVDISGFDIKTHESTTTLTYTMPTGVTAIVDSLQISLDYNYEEWFDVPNKASIEQHSFLRLQTPQNLSFDKIDALLYHLQNFLSLAFDEVTWPERITGYSEEFTTVFQGKTIHDPIRIVFASVLGKRSSPRPLSMLFGFRDIRERFDIVMRNWFAKSDMLEPIFLGYFAPFRFPEMYLEQKFLGYAQVIEAYHRRVLDGVGIPMDDYARILPEIIKCVPPENREWFSEKLAYNEPSHRSRLKELTARFPWMDFGGKDFVERVVVTRNYLTHYDKNLKDRAASREELQKLMLKLELLIKLVLLLELGFEQQQIETMIKRTNAYAAVFRS